MKRAAALVCLAAALGAASQTGHASLRVVPREPAPAADTQDAASAAAASARPPAQQPAARGHRPAPRSSSSPESVDPRCSEALAALSLDIDARRAQERLKNLRCE